MIFGQLFLTSCVALMAVFTRWDDKDPAPSLARLIGVVLPVAGLSISLLRWWRQRNAVATAPTPGQLREARETRPVTNDLVKTGAKEPGSVGG